MKYLYCFKRGTIVRSLKSTDRFQAIKELLEKAPYLNKHPELANIKEEVLKRETLCTTGIGKGVAIAHGRVSNLKELIILLGISEKGINFEAPDSKPVKFLFLIANNCEKDEEYLVALSTIASILRNQSFRDALLEETNSYILEKIIAKEFCASLLNKLLN